MSASLSAVRRRLVLSCNFNQVTRSLPVYASTARSHDHFLFTMKGFMPKDGLNRDQVWFSEGTY